MFRNLMNRYYYGKAGQADYTPDDLPATRWQLFWEMLRTHPLELVKLNLIQLVFWIPAIVVIFLSINAVINQIQYMDMGDGVSIYNQMVEEEQLQAQADGQEAAQPAREKAPVVSVPDTMRQLTSLVTMTLLLLAPCIAITGPGTAGVSYITRNWARSEHAFLWSDFKDAMKENWKQSIVVSLLTGLIPLLAWISWLYYGEASQTQPFMAIPQVVVAVAAGVWALCVTYMHPLIVSYRLKIKDVLRNALLLGIARLPMSLGIRLLHCVPAAIGVALFYLWNPFAGMFFLFFWYTLIGFALSRFVTASYTNGVFDRYINSRIEGAQVNRGMRRDDEDEEEGETAPEESADGTPEA